MITYSKLHGFTLIELLLTVAMIMVIGFISSIYLSRSLLANSTQNTTDYLAGTLRKAQSYAMSGKNDSKWGVNITGGQIILFQGNSYASRVSAQDQTYNLNSNVNVSGFSEVTFTKNTGTPSSSLTITLSALNISKVINLSNQGLVSY